MSLSGLKRGIKRTFASPLGWRVLGPMMRRPGVMVLTYHRIVGSEPSLPGVPIETFASQMRWVRENCEPIAADAVVERAGRPRESRPAVLVTFDDGYRSYHDLAYPVLKELGIPATVFLITSLVDAGGMLWTDEVQWAALSTTHRRVRLPWASADEVIELPDDKARAKLGEDVRAHLKTVPDTTRRAALNQLLSELGSGPPRARQMLTWDEVRATMDLTTYGGHSHTHPILSRLERETAEEEIRTCRDRIAAETQRRPTFFAYPNGQPADYTPETQEILRRNGFTVSFSTSEGVASADTDWMAVKRIPVSTVDDAGFAWLAAGLRRR